MDIRLIAMDLDGTALSRDRCHFTPRMERCLLEAHRRGIAVLPVTGRQFGLLPPALQTDAPWRDLAVCCNGGELRRLTDGAVLHSLPIPSSLLPPLLEITNRLGLPVEFSSGGVLYLTRESLRFQRLQAEKLAFHLDYVLTRYGSLVDDLAEVCASPGFACEKVNLPYIPEESRGQIEAALRPLPLSWAWSGPNSIEISHPEATKANGLQRACAVLGIDPGQVLALGDSGNDISMLRIAGFGVAMGGAPASVRAAADAVTASHEEDGAAQAIERWVLR